MPGGPGIEAEIIDEDPGGTAGKRARTDFAEELINIKRTPETFYPVLRENPTQRVVF